MSFTVAATCRTVEIMNPNATVRECVDLEQAVELHYRKVYHFALHLARDPEEAADLTQYAYEQLTRKHEQIRDPGKVKSWLQSTLYRKFIDQKRRIIRFPQVELDEEATAGEGDGPFPGNSIDAKAAVKALYQLEDHLRAPLSLFYLESCSYREIASILDLPVGTVMSRLHRGKQQLYTNLTNPVS